METNSAGLTDLERQVIAHRFPMEDDRANHPPTLQEVGRLVGYSKERVRQIQKQALDKIRSHMESAFAEGPFAGQA
jgi:DNA-directed RNA polymerase sigma subunit (sigma70/sigma32)